MTNEQRDLLELADHVEAQVPENELDMGNWVQSCGTVGCLAFHAAKLFPDKFELKPVWRGYDIINRRTGSADAGAFGDAFGPGSGNLCYPSDTVYPRSDANNRSALTPAEVAKGIRKFVAEHLDKPQILS